MHSKESLKELGEKKKRKRLLTRKRFSPKLHVIASKESEPRAEAVVSIQSGNTDTSTALTKTRPTSWFSLRRSHAPLPESSLAVAPRRELRSPLPKRTAGPCHVNPLPQPHPAPARAQIGSFAPLNPGSKDAAKQLTRHKREPKLQGREGRPHRACIIGALCSERSSREPRCKRGSE